MNSPHYDNGMADMQDLPMSAMWCHELGTLRDTLRLLKRQHADAAAKVCKRSRHDAEQDAIAQRLSTVSIERIDRLVRTMEAAGVLSLNG